MNDAEIIKSKQDEIYKITSELKSHYFLETYFVDPDKTFVKLLEKIINFFEDDDFVLNIKENEHLYMNFKNKYESAVELIKNIETEKEKLSNALKKNKTNQEIFDNYIKDHKHTQNYVYYDDDLISAGSPNCTNNKSLKSYDESPKEISQFQIKPHIDTKINAPSINIAEFEKLKEDYFALYEEKKILEAQLNGHSDMTSKLSSLREYSNRLQLQIDSLNERLRISNEEKQIINERLSKITRENNDLLLKLHSAKESLNAIEKEKNNYKAKISTNVNRVKILEKEINVIKKKNQNLNFQVSSLMEKLNTEKEMRLILEKRNEENFQQYEKKISTLEKDKQKIMKDSFTSLLEVINKQSCLDFYYRKESNKIDIYFENEKIGEFDNKNKAETTFGDINKQAACRNSPCSNAIYFNNKEKSFGIDSPLRLQKLFSNNNISCSSNKRSSFNVTPNNDKENVNIINFNSSRHNSQNKLNNIINLSSNKNKRYKSEFKLDIDERDEYEIPSVNKFNENKVSSCINDINIHPNMSDLKNRFSRETRFYLTNTNNKNMISLEQVFGNGDEEISNINMDVNRKLSFTGNYINTCSSHENVDIAPKFNYEITSFDFIIEKESFSKKWDTYEIRRSVDFLQKGNLRETREESELMNYTDHDALYAYKQNCIVESTNSYYVHKRDDADIRVKGKCSNCMIF